MSTSLLAEGIGVRFDGVIALEDVRLSLEREQILGLVGPNGAGKTTMVNVLTGFQPPTTGSVAVTSDGRTRRLTGLPPHRVATSGVCRTFQNVRGFSGLTVRENIECGGLAAGLRRREARREVPRILERVGLDVALDGGVGALAYGDLRRLGIARALAMRPSFLLLDEPAAGMQEAESAGLAVLLRRMRQEDGLGILIIEHDMPLIMGLCDRVQVLDHGTTIALGTAEQIRTDDAVRRAYLGSGDH